MQVSCNVNLTNFDDQIRQFIMANVVKCSMCPMLISSENPSTFFDHVRFNHRNTGKFHVVCKYPDCLDEYNLYISFKRHWYKNHGRRALVTVPNHPLVNHDRGNLLNLRKFYALYNNTLILVQMGSCWKQLTITFKLRIFTETTTYLMYNTTLIIM